MKGLILKDFINVKGQIVLYLLITVLWIGIGFKWESGSFFSGVMQMFAVMIPLTALAYDEKNHWNRFALTMPVNRRELVQSKFLFALLTMVVVGIVSFAGSLLISGDLEESVIVVLYSCPIGVILNGLLMPVMFQFGVEKGRFVYIGVVALFVLLVFGIGTSPFADPLDGVKDSALFHNEWGLMGLLWLVAVAVILISMVISGRIYGKKEF